LINAANNNGNSHFLDVPLGVAMITDILIASPIINEGMDMGGAGVGAGVGAPNQGAMPGSQFADYGGVDPNLDPELAMALRISMEEARARQNVPEGQAEQQQPAQV
jgi:26S proteasome regulatory subunit N10